MPPVFGPRSREEAGALAVAQCEHRDFRPVQPVLDQDAIPRRAEAPLHQHRLDRRFRLAAIGGDHDALAGRQPVRLDDDRSVAAPLQDAPRFVRPRRHLERGGRDAVPHHELLGEHLARLDLGRGPGGAEELKPLRGELVGDAGGERRLGPDHGEIDAARARQRRDAADIGRIAGQAQGVPGDAGVPRQCHDLRDAGAPPQAPCEGVLARAASDHQDFHGRVL
jgi:hypothetical protein